MAFNILFKPPHLKRFAAAVAAGLAAIVVYLGVEHFRVVPGTAALDESSPAPLTLGIRSIAVVPVRSGDSDLLTPGVAVEIIRRLAGSREVEVIAPRSALAVAQGFRAARPESLPFGVAWVLEIESAAIELSGGEQELRLSASLFEAQSDLPAWGMERRRSAGDLAAFIEDTLSGVARHVGFNAPAPADSEPAVSDRHLEAYLAAGYLQLAGGEGLVEADRLLRDVTRENPAWAGALAGQAYTLLLLAASEGAGEAQDELVAEARGALQEALAVGPELAAPYLYRSLLAHRFDWNWQAARVAAEAALSRAPGDAAVLSAAATAAFTLGDFERGEGQLRRAVALDPLVLSYRLKYGLMLEFAGRYQTAIDAYRELMEIDPGFPGGHAYLGRALVVAGMPDAALPHMQIEQSPFWQRYGMVLVLLALDRDEEAERRLADFVREHGHEAAVQIAEIEAFRGSADEAFHWLEKALEQRDPGLAALVGNPLFDRIRTDERWSELLDRLGLKED